MEKSSDYLFEASWEVCNKVGGIYTVLSSKADQMMSHYRNYFLVGPYFDYHARTEFTEEKAPEALQNAFNVLKRENIICHYGSWDDVKSKPKAILIEFLGVSGLKNDLKKGLWEDYGIDSLRGYWDFEEPMLWAYCVGRLIHEFHNSIHGSDNGSEHSSSNSSRIIGHFHEWLAAFALLYLKKHCPKVATIFTTHATMLGRTLASNDIDLYSQINNIDPNYEAYRFGMEAKHLTERAAAINAHAFTTVSEITGIETEKFLSRRPDVILYNGLDAEKFPSFEDISIKHKASRDKIKEFLTYYYFPYYTFDLDKNLIFYTVGRYEFHNKGYDLLIKALGKLNNMLRSDSENNRTVTVFFWIPMEHHGLKMEILENKNYYMHIKNYISSNSNEILTRLIYDVISKNDHANSDVWTDSVASHLKKDLITFERSGNPSFSTHNINESNNQVVNAFKENGLLNRKEDSVKVIVEPVYLDGNDGFIELTYYDAIIGCHLGLFPSYYEPWGYTPLESVALGVPALTTDLSGFGMFAEKHDTNKDGLFVLKRLNKNENDVVDEFAGIMHNFLKLSQQQRVDTKINAKNFSKMADWKLFVENYINAHKIALSKVR